MHEPILALPKDQGTYILDTDASDYGLGAVLSQQQKEGNEIAEKVIAYASKTLSRPERKYETTRKELLAIVYGLRQFKQYLLGRPIIIRTDHAALSWLKRTAEPMPQLARWLTFIEQFDYTILHRAGERHGNADGLSRKPAEDEVCDEVRVLRERSDSFVLVGESLPKLQRNDPELGPIVNMRLLQEEPPDSEVLGVESELTKKFATKWPRLVVKDELCLLYTSPSPRD